MQIQLKQAEIVIALKMYIVSQGIILAGKEVGISFTAGRKEAGVLADISIEDPAAVSVAAYGIPVDAPAVEEAPKPVAAAAVAQPTAETVAAMEEAREIAAAETAVAEEPPFATEAPVAKANSLFS
jgi:hypothetical protein